MSTPEIALKVDVDTRLGTREGVPLLLRLLERLGIRATFYLSLGPDNTGKAVRRVLTRRGWLAKQLRTGALAGYDLRTLLSGTLLPPPVIGRTCRDQLLAVGDAGHEVGTHAWDHVMWDDLLPWLPKPVAAMELGRAGSLFQEIFGRRTATTAAPGWALTADSLEIQDAMGLSYCSDCRGRSPFYPVVEGRRFATLQVPVTWPTLDELPAGADRDPAAAGRIYRGLLTPGLHVWNIHAEFEGGVRLPQLTRLLEGLAAAGARFITLGEAAARYGAAAPAAPVAPGFCPGRPGPVALQGDPVAEET